MNLPLPPRPLRRAVLAPAVLALTTVVLSLTPFVVLGLAFAVRFLPGRWRPLRIFWFLVVYLVRESVGIVALATLWVLSGFGWRLRSDRFELAHVALVGWFLRGLVRAAGRSLGLVLVSEGAPPALVRGGDRPVLVLSRHAGAGDSFILVHLLVNAYRRRPHIVLKDLLQLDPCVDIALNRLPNRFISANPRPGSGVVESISELAAEVERDGALVLFPEGGNFSESRRRRAIGRLEREGHDHAVALARELTHVLPPRPGGAFAAIDAAPSADVLFVAHTGLEQLSGPAAMWRGLPMDRDVRLRWWAVPAEDVPDDVDERVAWLFEWWERIDTWIGRHRDPDLPLNPVDAVGDDGPPDTQGTAPGPSENEEQR